MKITKNKLQTIIKEEVAKFSGKSEGTTTEELLEAVRSISKSTSSTLRENKDVLEIMIAHLKKHLTD